MHSRRFDDASSLASFVTLAKHEGGVFALRGAKWDIKWPGMVIYLHSTFCKYNWIHIQLIRCPAPTYRCRCTAVFDGTLDAHTQTQWRHRWCPGPALDYRHWRKVCSGPWKPPAEPTTEAAPSAATPGFDSGARQNHVTSPTRDVSLMWGRDVYLQPPPASQENAAKGKSWTEMQQTEGHVSGMWACCERLT